MGSADTVIGPQAIAGAGNFAWTNVGTFIEPDPTPDASVIVQSLQGGVGRPSMRQAISFDKPVFSPILHVINLDGSYVDVCGTTTTGAPVTMNVLSKNRRRRAPRRAGL